MELASELEPSELKRYKAIADLYQLNQRVEIIWSQDEAISGAVASPST